MSQQHARSTVSLIAIALLATACDRRAAEESPIEYRPPVQMYGSWVRVQPGDGETLTINPGGTASGPPATHHFQRTTRWAIDRDMGQGMFCMGDKQNLACLPVRQVGDTLAFGDEDKSIYLRAREREKGTTDVSSLELALAQPVHAD